MKHVIIATAGHVDHGKTALIRALTNVDCDTHKEEKRRGITINLGFTSFTQPNGDKIGIIDVPGHKDFVRTMVSGVCGIDFVIMVISADSGIMPQTIEHLNILETLNVSRGIIALTKIDLVDNDLKEIAITEIELLKKDSFLNSAPIIEVSTVSGQGIEELRDTINNIANETEERAAEGVFRMFIDRFFSLKGFGSIAAGTILNGSVSVSDKLFLLPGGSKELKIRGLERYGSKVDVAETGDRAAINLIGAEKKDFKRGMILSNKILSETFLLDATLKIFKDSADLNLWSTVSFHTGTFDCQAKIHLLSKGKLLADESAAVQIHLDKPCVLFSGDRFVIRNTSGDRTIGGGTIVDTNPLFHRRKTEKLVMSMTKLNDGDEAERVCIEVRKSLLPISIEVIAFNLNKPVTAIRQIIENERFDDIVLYSDDKCTVLIEKTRDKRYSERIISNLKAFHRNNQISPGGLTNEEFISKFKLSDSPAGKDYIKLLTKKMEQESMISSYGKTWILQGHSVDIPDSVKQSIDNIENWLRSHDLKVPLNSEMELYAKRNNISKDQLKQYLNQLISSGKACHIDGNYIHASIVDESRDLLISEFSDKKEGFTIADYRDKLGSTRKICLLLFTLFDKEGLTKRIGDLRFLQSNNG